MKLVNGWYIIVAVVSTLKVIQTLYIYTKCGKKYIHLDSETTTYLYTQGTLFVLPLLLAVFGHKPL